MASRTQPVPKSQPVPKLRLEKVKEDSKAPLTLRDSFLRANISKILTKRGGGNTARNTARTSGIPSQRSDRFISTLKKPVLLKEVDEEQWYELTQGNGGTFKERMDFCNNMYMALKKKEDNLVVESILDEPKGYDDMSDVDSDKFITMRTKNPVYDLSGVVKTDGQINFIKKSEQHTAKVTKYKKYDHEVMVEFTTGTESNIYQKIRDRMIMTNASPHFLFNMCSDTIGEVETWYGQTEYMGTSVIVFEKPTNTLYNYLSTDADADNMFFYYNVFFQALIALAQFHRNTGYSIGNLSYDNFYYMYNQEFNGLPYDDKFDKKDDQLLYYQYLIDNLEDKELKGKSFFVPALNITILLHGLDNAKPGGIKKEMLKDYDKLFDLFIRKEHGGKMPDEINEKNKKASSQFRAFKAAAFKQLLEKDYDGYQLAGEMVRVFGLAVSEKVEKSMKDVRFYLPDDGSVSVPPIINDDFFLI
tara:strand:- start:4 stop:1422 length:1419 start_codon:yes stop_codon:yes gene_type:complete